MTSFIVVGVIGLVLLIAALAGDELWVDDDGHVSKWVSPRAAAVFMVWYGAFGGLLYYSGKAGFFWSSVFAVAWSVIATVFVVSVLNWCIQQECATTTGELIGRRGVVSNVNAHDAMMVVTTQVGELQEDYIARSIEPGPLHEGDGVVIVDRAGSVCLVKRAAI